MSRIKIRVSAGVFEVSLIRVIEETQSVEVLWDRGVKREFKWGSVIFGNTDGPVLQKPSELVLPPESMFHSLSAVLIEGSDYNNFSISIAASEQSHACGNISLCICRHILSCTANGRPRSTSKHEPRTSFETQLRSPHPIPLRTKIYRL